MNYIILNDVNSNTIQGLLIQNLPPITKPKIRTNIEEIDGKDGDIITKLGYSAYDKEFDIGLYGSYDVNEVISYFNSEGTVIFSNEDDKFYKYSIIEQIDFERLIRFKTAKVKMHVQPFKYSNTDEDIEIYATETDAEGTNLTINNTENGASFLDMQLKGQTTQDGTPTPTSPVNVNVVTGNTNVLITNGNIPHQEQNYTINLGTIELCEIGGYQDYLYKENNKWYKHKAIEKITLNGSETPTLYTALTNTTRALYRDILPYNAKVIAAIAGSGICNLLPYYYNWNTDVEGFFTDNNATNLIFRINKSTVGTTITSVNNFLSENNMTVYYILATAIDEEITDTNLIAQLEALRGASTYINQTNIITSGDLAPIIYVNVDTIDTNEIEVVNSGNYYSKPVVTITGIGTINLYLNDYQVFIIDLDDTETTITLDVENMEVYNINTGQLMNRQVTGDYNNFIFNSGTNIITWSGTIASVQVVNYSRWL